MSRKQQRNSSQTPSGLNPENVYPLVPKYQRIIQEDGVTISLVFGPSSYSVQLSGGIYLLPNQVVSLPEYIRLRKKAKSDRLSAEQRELFVERTTSRQELTGVKIPEKITDEWLATLDEKDRKILLMKERDYRSFLSNQDKD